MWPTALVFLAAGSCLLASATPAIREGSDPQTLADITKNALKNPQPEQGSEDNAISGADHVGPIGEHLFNLTVELRSLNKLFKSYLTTLTCPAPFHMLGSECFAFLLEDMPWEAARRKCLEMGADLAEPSDLTQLRLYVGNRFPRKSSRNFWIGGHSQNKVWSWLSGEAINERFWHTNEPSGNGECLGMFDGWENPLTDFPCENERRAVCERPLGK
ncbi:C-type lectin domain family 6 member A-like isoform X2 [Penaeus japonicus]|uniref:C-type lectin domain family 6 member A-like isoform X2 n=1 Tax=Penaeus japonicus TaxID=27405 RepID=UPI001C70FB75|nr:C-type lectin domain family 6 member A-like isoform X2 [Penaeus japonicus]